MEMFQRSVLPKIRRKSSQNNGLTDSKEGGNSPDCWKSISVSFGIRMGTFLL